MPGAPIAGAAPFRPRWPTLRPRRRGRVLDMRQRVAARLLQSSTINAATSVAAGQGAAGVVSLKVAALIEGVLEAMSLTKLKRVMVLLVAVAVVGSGGVLYR